MFLQSLLACLLPISVLGRGCGAPAPSPEFLELGRQFLEREKLARQDMSRARRTIDVDLYLHTIATSQEKLVNRSTLNQQFAVLVRSFAPYGFVFHLKGISETVNPHWSMDGDEMAMKRSLRRGSYQALNIYYVEDLHGDLGYCYYPTQAAPGSDDFIRDGCSVLSTTVPGGAAHEYRFGKTSVHEAGHWFGLIHTFEGGCDGDNDQVDDTPAQSSASAGCPQGRDSCPHKAGQDPIHNYMDYSSDECYVEFTNGQVERMYSWWDKFRK